MMDCARTETLLPQLATSLLDPHEGDEVQAHLDGCPRCHERSARYAELLGALGEPIGAPPEVWSAIEEAIAQEVVERAESPDMTSVEEDREADRALVTELEKQAFQGEMLGAYQVVEPLAWSGPGSLYRAWHPEHGAVALKVLPLRDPMDRELLARWQREREQTIKVDHPGVVGVLGAGPCGSDEAPSMFLASEWVEGQTLDKRLQHGPRLETRQGVDLIRRMALILEHVHTRGGLHLDLHPGNVLLDEDGYPRLLNPQGLVEDAPASFPTDAAYAAPEQLTGGVVDPRADVYALGAILYELLCGQRAFPGRPGPQLLLEVTSQAPPPPSERARDASEADPHLDAVVLQALARDPADRYPSASGLAADLERWLAGEEVLATPPRSSVWGRAAAHGPGPAPSSDSRASSGSSSRPSHSHPSSSRVSRPSGLLVAAQGGRRVRWRSTLGAAAVALVGGGGVLLYALQDVRQREERVASFAEGQTADRVARARARMEAARERLGSEPTRASVQIALAELAQAQRLVEGLTDSGLPQEVALARARLLVCLDTDEDRLRAADVLREGLRIAPRSPGSRDLLLALAWLQIERGDLGEARARLRELEERASQGPKASRPGADVEALLLAGSIEQAQGRHAQAIEASSKVIDAVPRPAPAYLLRGRNHAQAGDPQQAARDLDLAISIDAERADQRSAGGTTPFARLLARFDRALLLPATLDDDGRVNAHLLRGQARLILGDAAGARADFEQVLDRRVDQVEAYLGRGRAGLALGEIEEAHEDLTEAIDLDPSRAEAYLLRGEAYLARRRVAEAIHDFEQALVRQPGFHPARLALGRALEWNLDYERAQALYDEAPEYAAAPDYAAALVARAELLILRADPWSAWLEAERTWHDEGWGAPDGRRPTLEALRSRSQELSRVRIGQARVALEEARRVAPQDPDVRLACARLALFEGQHLEARTQLQAAIGILEGRLSARPAVAPRAEEESAWDDEWDDEWSQAPLVPVDPLAARLAEARALLGFVAHQRRLAGEETGAGERRAYERALQADPSCPLARIGLALLEQRRAPTSLAGTEAGFFLERARRAAELSRISLRPTYFQEADRAYARLRQRTPLLAEAQVEQAHLCAEWSYLDVALGLAQGARNADPAFSAAHALEGELLTWLLPTAADPRTHRPHALCDPARGEAAWRSALGNASALREAGRAHHGLGRSLHLTGRLSEAEEHLRAALATIPAQPQDAVHEDFARWVRWCEDLARLEEEQGDTGGAEQARTRARQLEHQAHQLAAAAYERGLELRDQLQYSEAIQLLSTAVALDPDHSQARFERGTCYLKIGNFVPGILDFARALQMDPAYAERVCERVYQISYVVDLNRVISELHKIVADHPNQAHVLFLRGFFYHAKTEFKSYTQADVELGIADFDRALELDPGFFGAYVYRGFLHAKGAELAWQASAEPRDPGLVAHYQAALADAARARELYPSPTSQLLEAMVLVAHAARGENEQARALRARAAEVMRQALEEHPPLRERLRTDPALDGLRGLIDER
jgi:tetratricopeptide (TPR) repeat protein/serine/threonine protein kinase